MCLLRINWCSNWNSCFYICITLLEHTNLVATLCIYPTLAYIMLLMVTCVSTAFITFPPNCSPFLAVLQKMKQEYFNRKRTFRKELRILMYKVFLWKYSNKSWDVSRSRTENNHHYLCLWCVRILCSCMINLFQ